MSGRAKAPSKANLLASVKAHDYSAVGAALASYPELLTYRAKKGENLLHVCCGVYIGGDSVRGKASVRTAEVLIDAGMSIDEEAFREGEWKATPLWYAIGRGKNLTLAQYLIEHGATPEHCLWAAAYNDDPDAIKLLCNAGARIDPVHEETPLMFAVKWGRFAAAQALLQCGANPNYRDATGKTALHYMLKKRSHPQHFRMFLEHGARPDLADDAGETVEDLASRIRDERFRDALKKAT